MTQRNVVCKTTLVWIAFAALLLSPTRARAARLVANLPAGHFFLAPQSAQEKEQERSEREEEARDREEEKRDREQEARDREQEKLERQQELYETGREALDDDHYEQALSTFTELAQLNGPQTDAALYWKAYSENKLAKKAAALATISDLKNKFPQSKWKKDAEALE